MKPLDDIDQAIINQLKVDGRIANREIARRLNVSETMVRTRLKRLERDQVIRVGVVMDPRVDGLGASAYLGIAVKPGHSKSVALALTKLDHMGYVAATLGAFDILALALAEDMLSLQEWVSNEVALMEGVQRVEIMPMTVAYKHAAQWANISGSHPQK
ncbi:MAG: Lrp/AsnC family transcriptional regulator [Alphaproteobacteria bacterium]